MNFNQLMPFVIALIGSSGIVGLVTALIGRKNNQDDHQIDLIKLAYERNAYLEKRVMELEKAYSDLRIADTKKAGDIIGYQQKIKLLEQRLAQHTTESSITTRQTRKK